MTSRAVSPTANLLRHSRLFSLPPPLPKPSHEFAAQVERFSDTATLPYPTHATIETTPSSLSRGDWGLKRPLPLKSTTSTSTPLVRVSAIDSIDHITDFSSAADHALTLYKWQEMALSISVNQPRRTTFEDTGSYNRAKISVFEQDRNATDYSSPGPPNGTHRWKYRGPWLAGKTEGEFQKYVEKEIKRRRPEFTAFLRQWLRNRHADKAEPVTVHSGGGTSVEERTITNEELQSEIIKLRKDPAQLWPLIWEFLDLPGEAPTDRVARNINDALDEGPPTTHPSAGLYYLRTDSHISNHPILGPVISPPPVISRILTHQGGVLNQNKTTLGVAGVVAVPSNYGGSIKEDTQHYAILPKFDPELEGGAKTYVQPQEASIDSRGRIKLRALRALRNNILVWKGETDEKVTRTPAVGSTGPDVQSEGFFSPYSYLDQRPSTIRSRLENKHQNNAAAAPDDKKRFEVTKKLYGIMEGNEDISGKPPPSTT